MLALVPIVASCLASAEPPPVAVTPIAVVGRAVGIPGRTWRFRSLRAAGVDSPTSGAILGEFDVLPEGSVVNALLRFDGASLGVVLKSGDTCTDLSDGVLTIGGFVAGVTAPDGTAAAFVSTQLGGALVRIGADGQGTALLRQDYQAAGLPAGVVFGGPSSSSPPLLSDDGGRFAWGARVRGGGVVGSGEAVWTWDATHGTRLVAVSGTLLPGRAAAPLSVRLLGLAPDGVLIGGAESEFGGVDSAWVWRDGAFDPVAVAGQPVSPDRPDWTLASGPSLLSMGADGTVAFRASVRPTDRPQDPPTVAFLVRKAGVSVLVAKVGDQVPGMRPGVVMSRLTSGLALDDGRLALGVGMLGPGIVTNTSTGNDSLSGVWSPGVGGAWGPDGFVKVSRKGDLAPGPCGYVFGYPGSSEPASTIIAQGPVSAVRMDTYLLGVAQSSRSDLYLTDLSLMGPRRGILSDGLVTWPAWPGGGAGTGRLASLRFVARGTPGLGQQPLISPDGRMVLQLTLADGSNGFYLTDPLTYPAAPMADANDDGFLDLFDLGQFVGWLETGDERGDYNGDRFIDFFDYLEFIDAFESGC